MEQTEYIKMGGFGNYGTTFMENQESPGIFKKN
jgi:hypothetical protein